MATIEFTDEELDIVRAALQSYMEEFAHEQQGTVNLIQRVYAKVGGKLSDVLRS